MNKRIHKHAVHENSSDSGDDERDTVTFRSITTNRTGTGVRKRISILQESYQPNVYQPPSVPMDVDNFEATPADVDESPPPPAHISMVGGIKVVKRPRNTNSVSLRLWNAFVS